MDETFRQLPHPPKTPKAFELRARKYFDFCAESGQAVRLTGLILALGLPSRRALGVLAAQPEFAAVIERVKTRVELEYEKGLSGPAASMFALKNLDWAGGAVDGGGESALGAIIDALRGGDGENSREDDAGQHPAPQSATAHETVSEPDGAWRAGSDA